MRGRKIVIGAAKPHAGAGAFLTPLENCFSNSADNYYALSVCDASFLTGFADVVGESGSGYFENIA